MGMHHNTRGGDNARAHSGGKGESDDEHEHEQASRAIDSYTRRACRDSFAPHHSLQGSITSHKSDRSDQAPYRHTFRLRTRSRDVDFPT